MESLPDRSSGSSSSTTARPPKGGKLSRIASHTQGVVEDLRDWIDLRLDLAVLELEEKANGLKNQAGQGIVLALLGFFTLLFALVTAALGLGWALGHPFWGFLIVFAVLALATAGFAQARPQMGPPVDLFGALRAEEAPDEREAEPDRPAREAEARTTPPSEATPDAPSGANR